MRIPLFVLVLAASVTGLVTAASANSFELFCSGVSCGTVNITNISGGVHIAVNMTGGYSIQAEAHNSFGVNTVTGLTVPPVTMVTTTEFGSVTTDFLTDFHEGSAGDFTFGVDHFGIPAGNTSVTGISFDLMGVTTSNLLANSNSNVVAVHFCSPGVVTSCPGPTGFTTSRAVAPVPEPGTLGLLGTGLVGVFFFCRKGMRRSTPAGL